MKLRASLLFATTVLAAAATPGTSYFLFQRPVVGSPASGSQGCVAIAPDVFAHAAPLLADLRLYQGSQETPYALRVASSVVAAQRVITPLNLGLHGKQTVFDAVMPQGKYSGLALDIAAQDFLATVSVTGSQVRSGGTGTSLGVYTVFDLSSQKLGRSTVLHLPESDFRYLHFTVTGPVPPEKITGLSVERMPASEPKYVTVASTTQVETQDHFSLIEFTVPAHVPVDRIVFDPAAQPETFTRDVSVTAMPVVDTPAHDDDPAKGVATGNLLRLHRVEDGHRIDEERLSIDAPAANFDRAEKWTIRIQNGSDAPLGLQSVRLEMLERTLCFQAAVNAQYALYYGDAALSAPQYDYAALFIAQPGQAHLTLGAEEPNPGYQARPDQRPFTERHPALLWAALVAVIGLLAAIALRSAVPEKKTP